MMISKEEIDHQLNEVSNLLQKFYECTFELVEGKVPDDTPNNLMQQIVNIRKNIQQSIYELKKEESNQQTISSLEQKLTENDDRLLNIAKLLYDAKSLLQKSLNETQSSYESIVLSQNKLNVEDIIVLSNRITYTTSMIDIPQIEGRYRTPFLQPFPDEKLISTTRLFRKYPSSDIVNLENAETHDFLQENPLEEHKEEMDFGIEEEAEAMDLDFGLDEEEL